MDLQSNDRLIWLGLGVTLYFAGRGILAELRRIRGLTEIKDTQKDEYVIEEATEDALKLETLQKLAETPSYELRAAALKIVAERSTKGSTRDLLLEDLSSQDPRIRSKALNALHFLVSNRTLNRTSVSERLRDVATFRAFVNCLCNLLKEHGNGNPLTASPVLPQTRPLGEGKALATLNILLPLNIPAALEAGLVRRWLAKYPFPCAVNDEHRRRDVFTHMRTWYSDDPHMAAVINTISSCPEGVKQLKKYHLMWKGLEEVSGDPFGPRGTFTSINDDFHPSNDDDDDDDSDVFMVDGEGTAGAPTWTTRRQQERSAEEQALRRRRREAMVFSEGGRPLGRDDIIQPIQDGGNDHREG